MTEAQRPGADHLRKRDFTLPEHLIPVEARDGRILAAATFGPEDGKPVFYLHGSPGSRVGPIPRPSELHHMRTRIITYDRPGYGYSTRKPGRTVADDAEDVRTLADHFGYDRFAVVGRSGGGPGALASAALLPDRVTKAAALESLAPKEGAEWYQGMADSNVHGFTEPASDQAIRDITELVERIQQDPGYLIRSHLWVDLTDTDRQVVNESYMWRQLVTSYAEGLRQGAEGWIDDTIAKNNPWGFDFADIMQPVLLWQGTGDKFSPPSHTLRLKELIPHAIVQMEPDKAHFSAFYAFSDVVLPWISDKT